MRLGNRARPYLAEGPGGGSGTHTIPAGAEVPGVGRFRNVHIAQVAGEVFDTTGCAISGIPGHRLENVTLDGIQLAFEGGGTADDARRDPAEMETEYPEYKMFGRLPAFGMYCRHVKGLRLRDVQVGSVKPDARPGLVCDDVEQLDVRGWHALSAPAEFEEIHWRNVSGAWLHGGRTAPGASVHLRVTGARTGAVRIGDTWCREPARLVVADDDVPPGSVVTA